MALAVKTRTRLSPSDVRERIQAICDEMDYDPFTEMIRLAKATKTMEVDGQTILCQEVTAELQFNVAKEIASYLAPKLKQLEVAGKVDHEYTFKMVHVTEDSRPPELRNISPPESPAIQDAGN